MRLANIAPLHQVSRLFATNPITKYVNFHLDGYISSSGEKLALHARADPPPLYRNIEEQRWYVIVSYCKYNRFFEREGGIVVYTGCLVQYIPPLE